VRSSILVVVRDEPKPQGSKTAVISNRGGVVRAHVIEGGPSKSRRKFDNWRESVRSEAQKAMDGRAPLEGPLVVALTFTLRKPASAPKTRETWPCKKPDLDKLARSVLDGLTAGGVWLDDAQVVEFTRLAKKYPTTAERALPVALAWERLRTGGNWDVLTSPGAVIRVMSLEEWEISGL
jgi:Holliday junction resolvase RusA-like endonuclease